MLLNKLSLTTIILEVNSCRKIKEESGLNFIVNIKILFMKYIFLFLKSSVNMKTFFIFDKFQDLTHLCFK